MAKSNNTLLYAGLGVAAFFLLKKNNNNNESSMSGIGASKLQAVGKVVYTEFRNFSNYGAPSYFMAIETPEGEIIRGYTAPNSSIAYGIRNAEYALENHLYTYTIGKKGAIFHMVRKI